MGHIFLRRYLTTRRKTAQIHSANTLTAKALLRAMDKKKKAQKPKEEQP